MPDPVLAKAMRFQGVIFRSLCATPNAELATDGRGTSSDFQLQSAIAYIFSILSKEAKKTVNLLLSKRPEIQSYKL